MWIQKVTMFYLAILLFFLPGLGCGLPEPRQVHTGMLDRTQPSKIMEREKSIPSLSPPPFVEKVKPVSIGLEEKKRLYCLTFLNAPLGTVLNALTRDSALNLSVEFGVSLERPVTVSLKDATLEEALDMIVVRGAGYAWQIKGSNLFIRRFEKRVYRLDYLDLIGETSIDIGGDMLASGVENAGVSGKFQVTGKREKKNTDVWDGIQRSLMALKSPEGNLRIDRNAGIIYMIDTPRNIDSMVRFLDAVSESLHRQVFIEAKIMEVTLSDKNTLGIDWSKLKVDFKSNAGFLPDDLDFSFNRDGSITLSSRSSVKGVLDFLRTQGDISVLSNPHLALMNGQSAIITVGYQFPYGDIDGVDRDADSGLVTYGASIKRAVLGLQLGITAQISRDGLITLHVVPTITRIQRTEEVDIPTIGTSSSTISNPVIDLQELSTMVRVRDGQSIVLGGLISQIRNLKHEGLPWLSSIPFIGSLFNHMEDELENKELVIFLTPHIKRIM